MLHVVGSASTHLMRSRLARMGQLVAVHVSGHVSTYVDILDEARPILVGFVEQVESKMQAGGGRVERQHARLPKVPAPRPPQTLPPFSRHVA